MLWFVALRDEANDEANDDDDDDDAAAAAAAAGGGGGPRVNPFVTLRERF